MARGMIVIVTKNGFEPKVTMVNDELHPVGVYPIAAPAKNTYLFRDFEGEIQSFVEYIDDPIEETVWRFRREFSDWNIMIE